MTPSQFLHPFFAFSSSSITMESLSRHTIAMLTLSNPVSKHMKRNFFSL